MTWWAIIEKAGVKLRARFRNGSVTTSDPAQLHAMEKAAARHGETVTVHTDDGLGGSIVYFAQTQVGVTENPSGSNWGDRVSAYLAVVGWHTPAPWCAAFACWCLKVAGHPMLHPSASVFQLRITAQTHGNWIPVGPTIAQPGWLACFLSDEHVEIVVADHPMIATVDTIGGNTTPADGTSGNEYNGGCVARRLRQRNQIAGFIKTY